MAGLGVPRPSPRQLAVLTLVVAVGSSLPSAAVSFPRPPATAALPAFAHEARLGPTGDALGDAGDSFGVSVAADGDTVAVGVPGHDLPTADAGCVYVYERNAGTWTEAAKLTSPQVGTGLRFGSRVALEGDTLVVATESGSSWSRVYVFVRLAGAWSLQATLTPPVQAYGFGGSLALSGDTLAVGAPDADTGFGSQSGAAFVYTRVAGTWALEQEILGFEIAASDNFGAAVALDGDRLAVGAPYDDPGTARDAGSVYLFGRAAGSWSQLVKLVDPAGGEWFRFGKAVALDAGTLAVGAPGQGDGRVHVYEEIAGVWIPRALLASTTGQGPFGGALALSGGQMLVGLDPYGSSAGAAEIFAGSGASWTPGTPLVPAGIEPGDSYGTAVALTGGTAIVGAANRHGTGAVWVWTGSGSSWTVQSRLDNPGTATADAFGSASALENTTLVVGAPDDDTVSGRDSGAVYVFERVGTAWELRQKLLPPPGLPGTSPWTGPQFGASVALSGDRLAVGAPRARAQGRVFVFTRTAGTWALAAELAQSDPSSYAQFGAAVALGGTRLLVGAPEADSGTRSGAVYAFEETGGAWVPRQKVVSAGTSSGFGAALAMAPSGTIALAGAPVSGSASVLALAAGAWGEVQRLVPATPASPGDFGKAVALTETDAFVGAPTWSGAPYYMVGAVHVFRSSGGTWTAQALLEPPTDAHGQGFGSAIAVDGTLLAIGAPGSDDGGAVHLFEAVAGAWTRASLLAGDGVGQDPRFGASLAAHGGRVVVGEPDADSPAGSPSGVVHVFGPSTSDVAIAISGPTSAPQGAFVTVGVQLTNSGPSPVVGAAFRVTLGAGLALDRWNAAAGTCSRVGDVLACSLPSVAVGTSIVAEIQVAAVAVGTWPIVVSMASSDPNPSNDIASLSLTVSPSVADVSLSVSGPVYARVGESIAYTIALSNSGPGAAAGLVVEMVPPPGLVLDHVVGCDPVDCRIVRLGVGQTWLQVVYQVPAGYSGPVPIVFSASVTTLSQDPALANNQDSHSSLFVPPPVPLDYHTITPCRLYDSRAPGGSALLTGEARVVTPYLLGCEVGYGARALALNVTVTGATAAGNVRVYPAYSPVPNVSVVNYAPGQTRAGSVVIGLSPGGDLAVRASQATGSVHVILDVVGYFE